MAKMAKKNYRNFSPFLLFFPKIDGEMAMSPPPQTDDGNGFPASKCPYKHVWHAYIKISKFLKIFPRSKKGVAHFSKTASQNHGALRQYSIGTIMSGIKHLSHCSKVVPWPIQYSTRLIICICMFVQFPELKTQGQQFCVTIINLSCICIVKTDLSKSRKTPPKGLEPLTDSLSARRLDHYATWAVTNAHLFNIYNQSSVREPGGPPGSPQLHIKVVLEYRN